MEPADRELDATYLASETRQKVDAAQQSAATSGSAVEVSKQTADASSGMAKEQGGASFEELVNERVKETMVEICRVTNLEDEFERKVWLEVTDRIRKLLLEKDEELARASKV
jgi:hypothetical protein